MKNYKKGDRFGGKSRYNGGRDSRKGDRSTRSSMHKTICSECGRDCEVPFRPTGDKPVFCSICFGKKDGSSGNRNDRRARRDSGRSSHDDKKLYKTVCDKCHRECEVPFEPTSDRPVFCNSCFGKNERGGRSANALTIAPNHYEKQFEELNRKLDSIMKLLSEKELVKKVVEEEINEEVVEKEAVKKTVSSKKSDKKEPAVKKKPAVKKTPDKKKAPTAKKTVKKPAVKKKSTVKKTTKKK